MENINNEKGRTSSRKGKKKGFTLIELMIVLGLIAVLIGFMVPKMTAYREKALETKAVNTAKQVENAVLTCYSTNKADYEDSDKLTSAVEKYTGKKPDKATVADKIATVVFTSDGKTYAEVVDSTDSSFKLYSGESATGDAIYDSAQEETKPSPAPGQ